MAQENVDRVRRGYEAFARYLREPSENHLPGLFEFLDPEIEWRGPREFPDLAETRFGYDGVRSYLETLFEAIEDYRMEPEEFIDAGDDRVLVFSREGGRGVGSGADVITHATAHLWTLRNGRAIRMESYWERADALEAAGLSE
jgi:ketosteroid isomerase-like protein